MFIVRHKHSFKSAEYINFFDFKENNIKHIISFLNVTIDLPYYDLMLNNNIIEIKNDSFLMTITQKDENNLFELLDAIKNETNKIKTSRGI